MWKVNFNYRDFISSFLLVTVFMGVSSCRQISEDSLITSMAGLKKIGEIPFRFSTEDDLYIMNIDDIVCDDEGNLYIADSGWNRIFKFSSQGRYLKSFGQAGQGPGEFMGYPQMNPLRLSFGNNQKIYVSDRGNLRLSAFSKEGEFISQIYFRTLISDTPQINSQEDFFLLSNEDKYVVHCYDPEGRKKGHILKYDDFYQYALFPEPENFPRTINAAKLLKAIGRNDHIYILSNLALVVYEYDSALRFINKFKITNRRLLDDYRIRLHDAISKGTYAKAFLDMHVDRVRNLLHLVYFNGQDRKPEIYRYITDGSLLDVLLIPDESLGIFAWDDRGHFYSVGENESIIVYEYKYEVQEK